jgi:phage shock protein PspC (stress-responsive transcriptional regulator)
MDTTKRCTACAEEMKFEARKCPHCGTRTEPLHRDVEGRKLAGVCAALGRQFEVDAALLRVGFVVALAVSGGSALMVYLLLWAFTPPSAVSRSPLQRAVDWLGSFGEAADEPPHVERRV